MSAVVFTNVASCLSKLHGTTCNVLRQSVRWASKSKNPKHNTIGKRRGYKKYEDDYVEAGMIIFRQFGLKVYPGENVGMGSDCTLFALRPGRVLVSREKLSPQQDSQLKPSTDAGEQFYKYFFHVVPIDPQPGLFRLVSQI